MRVLSKEVFIIKFWFDNVYLFFLFLILFFYDIRMILGWRL